MTPRFTPGQLHVHSGLDEMVATARALKAVGRKIALVPTMGALHDGHRQLLRTARRLPGTVLASSIFVNPLQFGPNEDYDRYPRPLEQDLDVCRDERVELVFTPSRADMYPGGPEVTVHPGPLGDELEGASRPGHFAGVLTVVSKLFNIIRPDYAVFGEKDYQQLTLIRKLARDLNHDVRIIGVPVARAEDGLARSSRNVYLDDDQRRAQRRWRWSRGRVGQGRARQGAADRGRLPGAAGHRPGPGAREWGRPAAGRRAGGHDPADRQHPGGPGPGGGLTCSARC